MPGTTGTLLVFKSFNIKSGLSVSLAYILEATLLGPSIPEPKVPNRPSRADAIAADACLSLIPNPTSASLPSPPISNFQLSPMSKPHAINGVGVNPPPCPPSVGGTVYPAPGAINPGASSMESRASSGLWDAAGRQNPFAAHAAL
ncbi:hypothetical protein S40285_09963 [Stachybotrys chlorohalonatus IBT 40285]|uniref:Uncharacterized protein n=1 Tax=Stachybotrys chlorohalonatus (strain IBT 40285) TaxID=1283841 RepID=A0A084QDP1_STAC4|nr:hypothetical protein S40285_09963 [Stachybotrys chlorohalonata IBT 40285]